MLSRFHLIPERHGQRDRFANYQYTPDNMTIYLDRKIVRWCTKVNYLGLYLIGKANVKIDLTVAERTYYGSFNNIRSVV